MSQLDDLNRIVASLSEAALDDTQWPATSALIDDAIRAKGSLLLYARDSSYGDIQMLYAKLCYHGQHHKELERTYIDEYLPIDERAPRIRRLPDSQVVQTRDLNTEQELKTSRTHNEISARAHFQDSLTVRLDGPHGTRIVWGIADPMDGNGWPSARVEMIERILPHLRQFVGLRQALVDAEALGMSLAGLLDNCRSCVIQLDRCGQIVAANDAAQVLLRKSDGISDRGGVLRAWLPSDDTELQKLLENALPRSGRQGVSGSMTLGRPSVLPRLVVHISPLEGARLDFRPLSVAALVLVVDPASRARIDSQLVAEALGLSPAESQVAVLLAEGKTVRDIATATDRSEKTIRWHLHHICNRHGISRQVELAQLVLSLADIPWSRD